MKGRVYPADPGGRGIDMRGRGSGRGGRSRHPFTLRAPQGKFLGANEQLPSLDYGTSECNTIRFLKLMGEYSAVNYKRIIAEVFYNVPPSYGEMNAEPEFPDPLEEGAVGKGQMSEYLSDKKEWKLEVKKIDEQQQSLFAQTLGQLSESSRSEIEDDEDWEEAFVSRDLVYLVTRIRATHIAHQSGNPRQDKERVRNKWLALRMQPQETSFSFRQRVQDYQTERVSVGLDLLPEEDLVIGIINRLDMSRYASLVKDFLDNERRGISELPENAALLWKEIKDTQILRFRSPGQSNLESVFFSGADIPGPSTAPTQMSGRGEKSG